jgi:hypothetical protein
LEEIESIYTACTVVCALVGQTLQTFAGAAGHREEGFKRGPIQQYRAAASYRKRSKVRSVEHQS